MAVLMNVGDNVPLALIKMPWYWCVLVWEEDMEATVMDGHAFANGSW